MINYKFLNAVNLRGRGGKERKLSIVFSNQWKRVNKPLYDYENGQDRIETKKQKNLQWLDPAKYNNLSEKDGKIVILFVVTKDDGDVDFSFEIETKKLVDRIWTDDIMEAAAALRLLSPKIQTKFPISVRDFYSKNKEICMQVYNSNALFSKGDVVVDNFNDEKVTVLSLDTSQVPTVYDVMDCVGNVYTISQDDLSLDVEEE